MTESALEEAGREMAALRALHDSMASQLNHVAMMQGIFDRRIIRLEAMLDRAREEAEAVALALDETAYRNRDRCEGATYP